MWVCPCLCQLFRFRRKCCARRGLPPRCFPQTKRAAPARSAPVPSSDMFLLAAIFEGVAIRRDFLREWSDYVERRDPGGQSHSKAEFSDFIRSCRSLFDSLYPLVPMVGWAASAGAPSPPSPKLGSAGVASFPLSERAPPSGPSSEGHSSQVQLFSRRFGFLGRRGRNR